MSDDAVRSKAVFFLVFLLLLVLFSAVARAQPAFQVKDLNTTRSDGISSQYGLFTVPDGFVTLGGIAFLAASDGIHGTELWRTDGTEAGTRLVADVCPGSCASLPRDLAAVGGEIFFVADDGMHGRELWKSDGTAAGTVLVRDLIPDTDFFSSIGSVSGLDGLALFSVSAYGSRNELWRSDGTAAGTFLLAEFVVRPNTWLSIQPLARLGGKLFFAAEDSAHGEEYWITDGTAAGTVLLKDIAPGTAGSVPGNPRMVVASGKAFFVAGGAEGFELWVSDGTEPGTRLVKDIAPGSQYANVRDLTAVGGGIFFFASDDGFAPDLWRSDGTAGGTQPVLQVSPYAEWLTASGSRLFFFAQCEVWTSDGTPAGTVLVKDLRLPPAPFCERSLPLVGNGSGGLLFGASDGVHGREPWESDGTPAGTSPILDLNPGALPSLEYSQGLFLGGRWYFRAAPGVAAGTQLWTTDGTAAGTRMLQINHQQSGLAVDLQGKLNGGPRTFFGLNGTLLFAGNDGAAGTELWRSDGTAAGTSQVLDLWPGEYSSLPGEFTGVGDTVYFRSGVGTRIEKLWRTDGTAAGTRELYAPIHAPDGPLPNSPKDLTQLGDGLAFLGVWWIDYIDQLMKTNGTPEGTGPVEPEPGTGAYPIYATSIVGVKDFVFLQADETLWWSNGTSPGTLPLGDILSFRTELKNVSTVRNRVLYFAGSTPEAGEELWRSDGTVAGTYLLAETIPGPGSRRLGPFASTESAVFFAAGGNELWKNDAAGTSLVRALPSTDPPLGFRSLTAVGNKVYFSYDDGAHGRELWVSDGTGAGTRMVEDILPGPGSSTPRDFHLEGNVLVFSASDGVHGVEPWRSNGTAVGTRMLQDLAPGSLSSSPTEFTAAGSNVYFAANDGTTGFELWALPGPALLSTFADVPASLWSWRYVEALAASGLTGGCGQDNYCPDLLLKRAEAAVFLVKASHGSGFVPPPATGTVFNDAPVSYWASPWIEQLAADGVTAGCGNGNFCPEISLSRAEAAVFLLRARYGSGFVPPPATGTVFSDVPASFWAARWIERLAAEGVTTGCGGGNYCPDRAVNRAEMAVFLTRMFNLPLP